MEENKKSKRIIWIDVCKFLGILAIYLGHFGDAEYNPYKFVFSFHVPLFFFLSGLVDNLDNEKSYFKYVLKKIKKLLIPMYGFGLISIYIALLIRGIKVYELKYELIALAKGCIRNTFINWGLWFFSCLFIIQIIFKLLKKIKFKNIILIIGLICYYISIKVIFPINSLEPALPYNIDSACCFIVYYTIGYLIYPLLKRFFEQNNKKDKILFYLLFILTGIYSIFVFTGKNALNILGNINIINVYIEMLTALIIITFFLCLGKILEKAVFLSQIGQVTFYLCANEYVVKSFVINAFNFSGFGYILFHYMVMFILTIIMLIVQTQYIIPYEKKTIEKCKNLKTYIKYDKIYKKIERVVIKMPRYAICFAQEKQRIFISDIYEVSKELAAEDLCTKDNVVMFLFMQTKENKEEILKKLMTMRIAKNFFTVLGDMTNVEDKTIYLIGTRVINDSTVINNNNLLSIRDKHRNFKVKIIE